MECYEMNYVTTCVSLDSCSCFFFFFTNLKVTKLCTSYRPIPEVAGIIICSLVEESFRSI